MADFFLPMLAFGPLVGGFSLGLESHAPYHVWADARAWSGRNGDGRGGPEAGFRRLRVRRSNLLHIVSPGYLHIVTPMSVTVMPGDASTHRPT